MFFINLKHGYLLKDDLLCPRAYHYFPKVFILEIFKHLFGVRLGSRCWDVVLNKVGKSFVLPELMLQ